MTDPSNSHEPAEPTEPAASPGPDAPALPAGSAPTDYPSGGYPPYGGPYGPGAQSGYDPQWAYAPPPGYGTPPGYSAPAGYGPVPGYGPLVYPGKSKVAAGILALLLGAFGIHNFYLGYTGKALFQLLGTLLSCGILALPIAIWAFIEGILILVARPGEAPWGVDASGMPLSS